MDSYSFFGDSERQAVLERIKVYTGLSLKDTDLYPNAVVCETVLSAVNSYQLPINSRNQNQSGVVLPLQQGLLDSDLFFGYKVAITIDARNSTLPSSVNRWQFGNPVVFTGGSSSGTGTASDMETIYNGKLTLNVSNVQKIQTWSTTEFRHIGTPAVAIGETAATPTFATIQNWSNDLKWVDTTLISLLGADQNSWQIDLTFGSSTPAISNGTTNGQNVLSVITSGFKIPQGTNAYRAVLEALGKQG